ncbi:transglycosylase SLT domain-containing protein [Aromatoleum petrolei]|uniref:Transglycosylase SLT domain-containing protein n=1 Tax=Aromatoleum petrolei TaxID=76116 RepID=A0ABX1MKH7_9RHOO|nr:transglycosylase SLT domain-containing protein [Aromatoleum petrolei]NMF87196.1 transglycosylase SLT domain-containing protein [Aromatoleum petrolei]QTQ34935.1 Transglycosylase SLT domain-containing protein [Aromatoleum petrolei]
MNSSPARRTFLVRLCQGGLLAAVPGLAFGRERTRVVYPPVPPAYRIVAQSLALPPKLFFAIAIQESTMQWGALALPWPWTLNVRRSPRRYQRYPEAVTDLKHVLAQGLRNVDCGPMQVNWHYHSDKLRTPELALDPWHNLRVAGAILLERRRSAANWFDAAGAYHSPGDSSRANGYARSVFARMERIPDHA